jgi:hypothetical protein
MMHDKAPVLFSMVQEEEIRRLCRTLAQLGIRVVLLKGSALAYWLYEQPHQRECGDIDLLVPSRADARRLSHLLSQQGGYRPTAPWGSMASELMCRKRLPDGSELEIDIHWGLINSPIFAQAFTFDELYASTFALSRLGANARGLMPVHALLHACLHHAMNRSIGVADRHKWFEDMQRLASGLRPEQWAQFLALAVHKRFAGLCRYSLCASPAHMPVKVPAHVLEALLQNQPEDRIDASRLQDRWYMFCQALKSVQGWRLRARWLLRTMLPSRDYLRVLYGREKASYGHLLWIRCQRGWRHLRSKL